ncbi:uncharacterized protein LOC127698583 [Mytilus californianus]|uniref:uncharacterized protein LOC127698583 n=1 Tax=Mytilus californianus TaxID=6549 RepID=UPI002245B525|nr:uncharacterized protein LOC127698583 [Mytilus californianus]
MSGYSSVCSEKMCPQLDENVKKKLTRISNESEILGKMIELSGGMGCSGSTGPQPGLTDSHKTTVKKSWANFVKKGDLTDLGMPMFIKLFEEAPEVKPLFKFVDTSNCNENTKLRNHVKGVFEVVGVAVDTIDDLTKLSSIVVDLGSRHFHYGTRKEHLPVVGKCLIHALSEGLGDEFTEDTKNAWLSFYNWLGGCFAKGVSTESRKK